MSTSEDTRDALSDITNVACILSICMCTTPLGVFLIFCYIYYYPNTTLDDASRRREERREQQRIRRAEMFSEQKEEINRKKREYMRNYRARKKATSQNSSNSYALTETLPATLAMGN